MDTSTSQTSDFQVQDQHRPSDEADRRARELFLTAGVGILCSKILKQYMDHCEQASEGKVHAATTMEQYSATVKELLTISIWLTLFEQATQELPTWFKEFIIDCLAIADKVQPKPPAAETNKKYNMNSPVTEICTEVSISLCMELDFGATANDALIYLGHLLAEARANRSELLEFALTQPVAALDLRIKQS
jgi:hypothetical protein